MDALTLPPAPLTVRLSEDGWLVDSFGSFSSSANPRWPKHRGVSVRLGSRPCENAKGINRDRTSYPFKTFSCVHIASAFNSKIEIKNIILVGLQTLSFHAAWVIRDRYEPALGPTMSATPRPRPAPAAD